MELVFVKFNELKKIRNEEKKWMRANQVSLNFSLPFYCQRECILLLCTFRDENMVNPYMFVNKKSFHLDIAIEITEPEKLMVSDFSSTFQAI